MRGRLINPFIAELRQLDTEATAADPDAGGPLISGYDPDFKEPRIIAPGPGGTSARKEKAAIFVPCQVEIGTFELLLQLAGGDTPNSRVVIVFHFQNLEDMGLVDPSTGEALIRKNDRLVAIRKYADNSLVQAIRTPPGLYVTEVQPQSFGLSGGERNLLLVTFDERELAVRP